MTEKDFIYRRASLAVLFVTLLCSGCATIMEGRNEDIFVNVTPQAASCTAYRNGRAIGAMNPTTRILTVSKSRNELTVRCTAAGYRDKESVFESNASAWGVAGALTLDLGIVDYSTGALNKYDTTITIVMERI